MLLLILFHIFFRSKVHTYSSLVNDYPSVLSPQHTDACRVLFAIEQCGGNGVWALVGSGVISVLFTSAICSETFSPRFMPSEFAKPTALEQHLQGASWVYGKEVTKWRPWSASIAKSNMEEHKSRDESRGGFSQAGGISNLFSLQSSLPWVEIWIKNVEYRIQDSDQLKVLQID